MKRFFAALLPPFTNPSAVRDATRRRAPRTTGLLLMIALAIPAFLVAGIADAQQRPATPATAGVRQTPPQARTITRFAPINFKDAALREKNKPQPVEDEIEDIDAPQPPPPNGRHGVPIAGIAPRSGANVGTQSTPSFGTGVSPGPSKTFKAEFLSSTSIPPDTMGAVGTTHVVSVTNDRMRIQTRDGVEISRMTLTAFWAGVLIKGNT